MRVYYLMSLKKKISETLKRKYDSGELLPIPGNLGKTPSDEVKMRISNTLKEKYKKEVHPSTGKISKSSGSWKKGHIPWVKGKKLGPNSEESNKRRSDTMKEWCKNNVHPRKGKPSWNKGKKCPYNSFRKGKPVEKFECPHCGKFANKGNLIRWHLDNCKLKSQ